MLARDRLAVFLLAVVEHDLGAERRGALALGPRRIGGMTITAGMPSSFAAAATPWA